jgi:hypothetical protein
MDKRLHDMIPNKMLLNVSVLHKKKKEKRYNKRLLLILFLSPVPSITYQYRMILM